MPIAIGAQGSDPLSSRDRTTGGEFVQGRDQALDLLMDRFESLTFAAGRLIQISEACVETGDDLTRRQRSDRQGIEIDDGGRQEDRPIRQAAEQVQPDVPTGESKICPSQHGVHLIAGLSTKTTKCRRPAMLLSLRERCRRSPRFPEGC